MKKITLYIIALFITTSAWAQIPNASFENWGKDSSGTLDKWIILGDASKTSQSHTGATAILLKHTAFSGNQSYLAYGAQGLGGWPYVGRPDTLSFFAKGSIAAGDSVQAVVSFGKAGSPIGVVYVNFSVSDSINFTEIKIPISFYVPIIKSDTTGIYFLIGQVDSLNSWIIIDDVKLTKAGATEGTVDNPGFETWNLADALTGWSTSNEITKALGNPIILVEKTSDAKDGSAAIKLTNKNLSGFGVFPALAVTGIVDINANGLVPAFSVNKRFLNMTGYFKYAPASGDTCKFQLLLYKDGLQVGMGEYLSATNTSTYTKFNAPVKYESSFSGIPDSATVVIFAGSENGNPQAGSVLYTDQLELNDINAISNPENNIQTNIFPNPANNNIILDLNSLNTANVYIQLLDISGKQIKEIYNGKIGSGYTKIAANIADVPAGIYIVKISNNGFIQTNKLQIVK